MNDPSLPTRDRILAAAADIFGRMGFKDATIRRIAQDAGVNIAAINYHFRDKEGLYREVLEEVFRVGFTRFPATMDLPPAASPRERLRAFIRAMFYRLQSGEGWGGISGRGRLIARELLDPSPAFESILHRYVKPHKELLTTIIVEIMEVDPGQELLAPCAISIIGQCIYYAFASAVIGRISAGDAPTEANLDRLADFVWRFSLGGIEAIKQQKNVSMKDSP